MQEIKCGLHAYRYVEFDDAIKFLERRRQIVIWRVQSRGRVLRVGLKQNARAKLPIRLLYHRKKRRKRKKPLTQWFLERRHLMDAGQHSGFVEREPWQESTYWYEKEQEQDRNE
jgi:hypothetical protein